MLTVMLDSSGEGCGYALAVGDAMLGDASARESASAAVAARRSLRCDICRHALRVTGGALCGVHGTGTAKAALAQHGEV